MYMYIKLVFFNYLNDEIFGDKNEIVVRKLNEYIFFITRYIWN